MREIASAIEPMKNLTIALDEQTVSWVRAFAAKRNMSDSRLVGEIGGERMRESREYDDAMRRFFGKALVQRKRGGQRYATRNVAHCRTRLR